jgi:hypothetical protein
LTGFGSFLPTSLAISSMVDPNGGPGHPQRGHRWRLSSSMAFAVGLLIGAVVFTYIPPVVSQARESQSTSVNSLDQLADLLDQAGASCSFLKEPESIRQLGVEQTVVCTHGDQEHHLAIHTSRRELFKGLELMAGGFACMATSSTVQGNPMMIHAERWSVITTSRQISTELARISGASVTIINCPTGIPAAESASPASNVR